MTTNSHPPPSSSNADPAQARLTRSFLILAGCLTLLLAGLSLQEYLLIRKTAIQMAETDSRSSFNKDLVFRRWAANHGGIYVPETEQTPPSPYLSHIPERDITTPSGKKLTLQNPAYMTRQVYELAREQYGTQGHITSLNPIRPENAPDAWETKALQSFTAATDEVSSLETIDNEPYLRLMRPMIVEANCLKCHAQQGYKVGDIRGGISASVLFTPYLKAMQSQSYRVYLGYGLIWMLGLVAIGMTQKKFSRDLHTKKRADEVLQESEARYRNFFENNYSTMLIIDPESGDIVDANPAASTYYGWSIAEMKQMNIADINTLSQEQIAIEMAHAKKHDRNYFVLQHRRADGTVRDVEVYSGPLQSMNRTFFFSIIHDISKRKEAEKKLQRSEALYHDLVATSQDLIWQCDAEGRYTYLNPVWEATFGYSLAEMLGKRFSDFQRPEDAARDLEHFASLLAGGSVKGLLCTHLNKSGKEIHLVFNATDVRDENGNVVGTRGTAFDVTERKKTEDRLRYFNELMQYIISHAQSAIAVHDNERRYVYVSNNYLTRYNVKEKDIIGRHHYEIFPDLPQKWRDVHQRVLHGATEGAKEDLYVREDGSKEWTNWECRPWLSPDGSIGGIIVYTEIITERVKAKEQILKSLKEKEVMLKEIHHRVKNNMQVIYSLLNLQAKGIEDESVRAMFEESKDRVNSMALVHEKLYQSKDYASIDFNEYLNRLVNGIAETYKRQDIAIQVEMTPLHLDVNVGVPCGLIANELVSNSLKHAFPEGRTGTITLGINRNSTGMNVLTVEDNGIGFPADIDFRVTTSLGLQLVTVLAGQIHGSIELSREGGTKFTITFPEAAVRKEKKEVS